MAVAALSSQTRGTDAVAELSPRPLLVAHGTADEVLPNTCAMDIHHPARAQGFDPVNSRCRHGLNQCRMALDSDILGLLECVLDLAPRRGL